MHFSIIKIEPIGLPREDWDIDLDYEDETLNANTDYYGEMYDEAERESVIRSKWLKALFEGIATIDEEKGTITFLDVETIRATLDDYMRHLADKVQDMYDNGELTFFSFRNIGKHYKDYYTLFVLDYGQTSADFIEDSIYRAGETYQIGNVFDAHF